MRKPGAPTDDELREAVERDAHWLKARRRLDRYVAGGLAWQVVGEVPTAFVPGGPEHWRWPHAFDKDWEECPRLAVSPAWRVAVDWYLEHVGAA